MSNIQTSGNAKGNVTKQEDLIHPVFIEDLLKPLSIQQYIIVGVHSFPSHSHTFQKHSHPLYSKWSSWQPVVNPPPPLCRLDISSAKGFHVDMKMMETYVRRNKWLESRPEVVRFLWPPFHLLLLTYHRKLTGTLWQGFDKSDTTQRITTYSVLHDTAHESARRFDQENSSPRVTLTR